MLQLYSRESSQSSQSCGAAADSECQKVQGKIHPLPTQSLGTARDLTPISARISLITGKRSKKAGMSDSQWSYNISLMLQFFPGRLFSVSVIITRKI